jgi:methionine-rich copper-binding protein CopC
MSARAIRCVIVLAFVGATMWAPSFASAQDVRSQPPAGSSQARVPERVTITFRSSQARSTTIEVEDPCGARADAGGTSVSGARATVELDATASGRYLVTYAGISAADGSPTRGTFTFLVEGVQGCAAEDRPGERRAGRGIWDLPKGDFAVALGIAALIGAIGGLVYAAILGPKA